MGREIIKLYTCFMSCSGVLVTPRTHSCAVCRYGGIGGVSMSTPSNQAGSYDPGPSQENPPPYGQQPYGQGYSQGYDQPRSSYPAYPGPGGYAPAGDGTLGYLNGAGVRIGQA